MITEALKGDATTVLKGRLGDKADEEDMAEPRNIFFVRNDGCQKYTSWALDQLDGSLDFSSPFFAVPNRHVLRQR